jgi:hypothetical protein
MRNNKTKQIQIYISLRLGRNNTAVYKTVWPAKTNGSKVDVYNRPSLRFKKRNFFKRDLLKSKDNFE